jgi:hypothetical protein
MNTLVKALAWSYLFWLVSMAVFAVAVMSPIFGPPTSLIEVLRFYENWALWIPPLLFGILPVCRVASGR